MTAIDPVDPARAALLVMDYQQGILERLPDSDALMDRAAHAISLVRERGGHVGYVRVAFAASDYAAFPATSRMGARIASAGGAFDDGAPATAVPERIAPRDGDVVVRKTRVGAFSTTDLHDQLSARGVTTLILAGISTSGVVLTTVRDASDRDYRLLVLSDGCADRDPEVHAFLIERVFPSQAEIVTVDELGGVLSGGS